MFAVDVLLAFEAVKQKGSGCITLIMHHAEIMCDFCVFHRILLLLSLAVCVYVYDSDLH